MSIQTAYDEWSATYDLDENATRDLDEKATRELLRNLQSKHILEIGCGTGKNTNRLAINAETVIALDFSPAMLNKAKAKVTAKNASFCLADLIEHWPCADQAFELIVCSLVLEHIQDLSFVFAEAARMLGEQGRFFVSELHPYRQYQGQKANFQGNGVRREIEAFTHHISDYIEAAQVNGFKLVHLKEWWHKKDQGKPPRLVSFVFEKVGVDGKYRIR